jgi:hypothetical protein
MSAEEEEIAVIAASIALQEFKHETVIAPENELNNSWKQNRKTYMKV